MNNQVKIRNWTKKHTLALIEELKKYEELYKKSNEQITRKRKLELYEKIATSLNVVRPGITADEISVKTTSIFTNLKIEIDSLKQNPAYEPTYLYYKNLDFITKEMMPQSVNNSSDESSDVSSEVELIGFEKDGKSVGKRSSSPEGTNNFFWCKNSIFALINEWQKFDELYKVEKIKQLTPERKQEIYEEIARNMENIESGITATEISNKISTLYANLQYEANAINNDPTYKTQFSPKLFNRLYFVLNEMKKTFEAQNKSNQMEEDEEAASEDISEIEILDSDEEAEEALEAEITKVTKETKTDSLKKHIKWKKSETVAFIEILRDHKWVFTSAFQTAKNPTIQEKKQKTYAEIYEKLKKFKPEVTADKIRKKILILRHYYQNNTKRIKTLPFWVKKITSMLQESNQDSNKVTAQKTSKTKNILIEDDSINSNETDDLTDYDDNIRPAINYPGNSEEYNISQQKEMETEDLIKISNEPVIMGEEYSNSGSEILNAQLRNRQKEQLNQNNSEYRSESDADVIEIDDDEDELPLVDDDVEFEVEDEEQFPGFLIANVGPEEDELIQQEIQKSLLNTERVEEDTSKVIDITMEKENIENSKEVLVEGQVFDITQNVTLEKDIYNDVVGFCAKICSELDQIRSEKVLEDVKIQILEKVFLESSAQRHKLIMNQINKIKESDN